MRKIYLIRHGEPDFPGGRSMCLGATDLPLSPLGRMRAAMTGAYLEDADISAVFSSDLSRAVETAQAIGGSVECDPGFREAHFGEWEGLPFDEIRRLYRGLYEKRGAHPGILPPGGEHYDECASRFSQSLKNALKSAAGNIAVVSHSAVIKAFLGELLGMEPDEFMSLSLPCGSVTVLEEDGGELAVHSIGTRPLPALRDGLCRTFWDCVQLPDNIRAHCGAVSELAGELCSRLNFAGLSLDAAVVRASSLLHDIARASPHHADAGGSMVAALGYPAHGEIIRRHMELPDFDGRIDEAAVVYIADKLTMGSQRATLEARFAHSLRKCITKEALCAHEARLDRAREVGKAINRICGKELVI